MFEILSPKLSYYQIWPHEEGSLLYPRGGCLWNPIRNQANEKNTTFSYSISTLLFLLYLKAVFKHLTLGFKDKKRLIFIQKFLYSKNIFKTCKLKLPPNKSNLDIPLLSSQIIFFFVHKRLPHCLQNMCPLRTLESSEGLEGRNGGHSLPNSVGSRCGDSWICPVGLPSSVYLENSCQQEIVIVCKTFQLTSVILHTQQTLNT